MTAFYLPFLLDSWIGNDHWRRSSDCEGVAYGIRTTFDRFVKSKPHTLTKVMERLCLNGLAQTNLECTKTTRDTTINVGNGVPPPPLPRRRPPLDLLTSTPPFAPPYMLLLHMPPSPRKHPTDR